MSSKLQIVPSNIIEPMIVKACLTNNKYLDILSNHFAGYWFEERDYGTMVDFILKCYKKLGKIPSVQTLDLILSKYDSKRYSELSAKLSALNSIDISKYDAPILDEDILNYIRDRGLYTAVVSNLENITEKHSVGDVIELMRDLSTLNYDNDLGLNYLEDIDKHIEDITQIEQRISFGWPSLDLLTNGGMLKDGRCLCLFAGQTHIGKSLILSNIASNLIRQNKFVLIISLEMSEKVYATRIDAHLNSVDVNKVNEHAEKLKNTATYISENNPDAMLVIKEFPPDTVNCNHIQSYIEKLIKCYQRTPDVILIDYLNLLIPNEKIKDNGSYNKYRSVSTEMRKLSYIFERPIVSVIQNNRGGFDTSDPSMNQVADSIGIPFVADFIGGLFQNEGDREAGVLNVAILKNRLGGNIGKNIMFYINYLNLIISDIKKITNINADIKDLETDLASEIGEL